MNREVQSIVLILLGSAVTRISMTDIYLRYVKESLRPYLIATGLLLLLLGFWALWDVVRSHRAKPAGHSPDESHAHDHGAAAHDHDAADQDEGAELHDGHNHGQMRIAWLLLLPVLSILLIAPPALGAYSATREQATVLAPTVGFDPLPPGDPVTLALSDYAVRAVWDDQGTLAGHNIEMEGFVTPVPQGQMPKLPAGTQASWWLTRLYLTCCAADALVTKILMLGTTSLPANTWVKVEGHWTPGGPTNSDKAIPWFQVTSIHKIPEPSNPYE